MKTAKSSATRSPFTSTAPKPDSIRAFFARISLADRMRPVLSELLWVVRGCESPHEKILPAYCYRIFGKFRRTYFKELPSLPVSGGSCPVIDWNGLGQVLGLGLRCLRFGESELDGVLGGEGVATGPGTEELMSLLASVLPTNQSKPEEGSRRAIAVNKEIVKCGLVEGAKELWNGFLQCNQAASREGTESFRKLNRSAVKGSSGFMAGGGEFIGESSLANIHWFLLLAWPEIKQMQEARPRKTRNDFYEWTKPFAACGFVSLHSLEHLMDVSDRVGLKFTGRGAPARKK
jgi:hypothetical protein